MQAQNNYLRKLPASMLTGISIPQLKSEPDKSHKDAQMQVFVRLYEIFCIPIDISVKICYN